MIIDITDGVRIRYEDNNYMLEKRRVAERGKNAGTVYWDVVGYYGDLKSVATSIIARHLHLINFEVQGVVIKDLTSLINAVDCGADLVARACEAHKR